MPIEECRLKSDLEKGDSDFDWKETGSKSDFSGFPLDSKRLEHVIGPEETRSPQLEIKGP